MTALTPAAVESAGVLSFLGAAETVTGSRFLIDTPQARVLVDCGLFQGLKALRQRNWAPFPVDPASIDAIVLTHAHLDHTGYLPALCRDGFRGRAFATHGTVALTGIVLPDSGHIQEEEAAYANRRGYSKHHPALPLYTEHDARRSLGHLEAVPFAEAVDVAPGIEVTLRPAGHILGSAVATVRVGGAADARTVVFSGDLGRQQHPLLVPPSPPREADLVVIESTHGNRDHDEADAADELRDAIVRTAARGGVVVIPAFAVDRTEIVLFHLRRLIDAGEVPAIPVYVDSPMALAALGVYRRAIADHAPDIRLDLPGGDPFDTGTLTEVRDADDSRALAGVRGPAIIVSASGMATGGRILRHLAERLGDHRCCVILVGYQAEGTRGRLLVDGAPEVKLLGRHVRVRAEVVSLPAFSVHADRGELLDWLAGADHEPDTVFVVHGESVGATALRNSIEERFDWVATVAADGERVLIGGGD